MNHKKNSKIKIPTLDLHGVTTDEVYDRLDQFLTRCVDQGLAQARVMPGKGTGKIKATTLDYLKKARYPWSYEKQSNGQNNEGVLIVHLE